VERSSHKENKAGRNDLGALIVRGLAPFNNIEFSVGTGFSDEDRAAIWNDQDSYLGKLITYNYFPIGVKDKPRHPSYKGLRSSIDL